MGLGGICSKTLFMLSWNGILLPKLFWPTVREKSSDWIFFLKFEAEDRDYAKILRSLEQFIQIIGNRMLF